MSGDYRDLDIRKSVHINLAKDTHAAFRMILFQHRLSMQEVLEECAIQIIEGNEYFEKLIDELQYRKRCKTGRKFTKTDAESIFRAIKEDNASESNKFEND